jgi:signal transduction histidine kinase
MEARYEPVDLASFTADLASVFRSAIGRAGLAYQVDCRELPEPVYIDREMWEKVVLNLLSNALKFTKEGSVSLVAERGPGIVTIKVVDTGIGVSPEGQKRLFQKFAQADGGHSREYGGTGLGLVITKHLMEMMGGTISLFSEGAGRGTTMTVTVPIA